MKAKSLILLAPRAGFEPATNRLTAGCSTTELPGNSQGRVCSAFAALRLPQNCGFSNFAMELSCPYGSQMGSTRLGGAPSLAITLLLEMIKKERAGNEPGPKALGNGGVSSREDGR